MYSIDNVETIQGVNFTGYKCDLVRNGVKIGTVEEKGDGRTPRFNVPEAEMKRFWSFLKGLPPYWDSFGILGWTPDLYVAGLVDALGFEPTGTRGL